MSQTLAGLISFLVSFGFACFFAGWLFNAHVVARYDPQGTLPEYRSMTLDCAKSAFSMAKQIEKLASIKVEADNKDMLKEAKVQ